MFKNWCRKFPCIMLNFVVEIPCYLSSFETFVFTFVLSLWVDWELKFDWLLRLISSWVITFCFDFSFSVSNSDWRKLMKIGIFSNILITALLKHRLYLGGLEKAKIFILILHRSSPSLGFSGISSGWWGFLFMWLSASNEFFCLNQLVNLLFL